MIDSAIQNFSWHELSDILDGLRNGNPEETHWIRAEDGRVVEALGVRIVLPPVLRWPSGLPSATEFAATLPDELGLHLVVLLQAGAASLGIFEEGRSLETKTFKRYVVRGRGKAQTTYLKSKGKSRFGSRLRLQNARRLLVEVNDKLEDWLATYGKPQRLFYSASVRLWPDLFAEGRGAPLSQSDDWTRIRRDLPTPTTEVMLRTYQQLCQGQVETMAAD